MEIGCKTLLSRKDFIRRLSRVNPLKSLNVNSKQKWGNNFDDKAVA
jgi:hypothetical protein